MQSAKEVDRGRVSLSAQFESGAIKSDEQANNRFTSSENYFPVFEHNTRDLQSLEARVVINITSFYTYMKAVRDLMRTAAELRSKPVTIEASKADKLHSDTWHNAMRDVIYMLFLALEAGRNSIHYLVEFEPENAERTTVILLSELKAYLFLLNEFANTGDIRERRLLLRWPTYRKVIACLRTKVQAGVKDAKDDLAATTVTGISEAQMSVKVLTLELWQGAYELWSDVELLNKSLEDIVPKCIALRSTRGYHAA